VKKHTGIIIKTYFTKTRKCALLDYEMGMVEAIPSSDKLSPGSMIEYALVKGSQEKFFLQEIDLINIPLHLARQDILFFHHILELSYFFMLEGSHVPGMYDLLCRLFHETKTYSLDFKLLFLFKFFVLLGRFPYESKYQTVFFQDLAHKPIDTIINYSIDWNSKRELREWIVSCVMDHPYVQGLKTIHFLERDRLL
jgi:hypothetical protein